MVRSVHSTLYRRLRTAYTGPRLSSSYSTAPCRTRIRLETKNGAPKPSKIPSHVNPHTSLDPQYPFTRLDSMASTLNVEKPEAMANGSNGFAPSDDKLFTIEQLKEHGSRESLWLLLHGKVYDVTKFLDEVSGRYIWG